MEDLKQKGQSTVEFVLLIAVIALLATAVINNKRVQDFIGPNGKLFQAYSTYISFGYRHGSVKNYQNIGLQEDYSGNHDSYGNRFRIPLEAYPDAP